MKLKGTSYLLSRGVIPRSTVGLDFQNVADYVNRHGTPNLSSPNLPVLPPWPNSSAEFSSATILTVVRSPEWVRNKGQEVPLNVGYVLMQGVYDPNMKLRATARTDVDTFGVLQNLWVSLVGTGGPLNEDGATRCIVTTLFGFALCHCKNVQIADHAQPRKLVKKRKKQGKDPGITYKTLVIDQMTRTLSREGSSEKSGINHALHVCRGHFATYTKDKPLFGKVTGTFWRPMHVRGNRKHGEVRKDYRVVKEEWHG